MVRKPISTRSPINRNQDIIAVHEKMTCITNMNANSMLDCHAWNLPANQSPPSSFPDNDDPKAYLT